MRTIFQLIFILTLLSPALANAKIYKWVMPDGSVTYSDKPQEQGAESVDLPRLQTYTPAPLTPVAKGSEQASPESTAYESVRIISPAANETYRDNGGTVSVQLEIKPALQAGHTVEVLVDGKPVGSGAASSVSISNLDRGSHSVSANVKDDQGQVIKSAAGVTFHLQRSSKLSPTRKPKAPS